MYPRGRGAHVRRTETKRHEVTERPEVGQARYLRAGKEGRGQILCGFPFEEKENNDKSTL